MTEEAAWIRANRGLETRARFGLGNDTQDDTQDTTLSAEEVITDEELGGSVGGGVSYDGSASNFFMTGGAWDLDVGSRIIFDDFTVDDLNVGGFLLNQDLTVGPGLYHVYGYFGVNAANDATRINGALVASATGNPVSAAQSHTMEVADQPFIPWDEFDAQVTLAVPFGGTGFISFFVADDAGVGDGSIINPGLQIVRIFEFTS